MRARRAAPIALALALGGCAIKSYRFGDEGDAAAARDVPGDGACPAMLELTPAVGPTAGHIAVTLGPLPLGTVSEVRFGNTRATQLENTRVVLPAHRVQTTVDVTAVIDGCTARGRFTYRLQPLDLAAPAPPKSGFVVPPDAAVSSPADVEVGDLAALGDAPGILLLRRDAPRPVQILRRSISGALEWFATPPQPSGGADFRDVVILPTRRFAIAPYFNLPPQVCSTTACSSRASGNQFAAITALPDPDGPLLAVLTAHDGAVADQLLVVPSNGGTVQTVALPDLSDRRTHRIAPIMRAAERAVAVALPASAGYEEVALFARTSTSLVEQPPRLRVMGEALNLAAMDWDDDRDTDAVIIGARDQIRQWTLGAAASTLIANVSGLASPLAVADANGDGAPDLLVPLEGTATLVVLLGDGRGGFPLAAQQIDLAGFGCARAWAASAGALTPDALPSIAVACTGAPGADGGAVATGVLVLDPRPSPP